MTSASADVTSTDVRHVPAARRPWPTPPALRAGTPRSRCRWRAGDGERRLSGSAGHPEEGGRAATALVVRKMRVFAVTEVLDTMTGVAPLRVRVPMRAVDPSLIFRPLPAAVVEMSPPANTWSVTVRSSPTAPRLRAGTPPG